MPPFVNVAPLTVHEAGEDSDNEEKPPMAIFEWLVAAWMTFSLIFLLAIGQGLAALRNQLNRSAAQPALGHASLAGFDGQGLS